VVRRLAIIGELAAKISISFFIVRFLLKNLIFGGVEN